MLDTDCAADLVGDTFVLETSLDGCDTAFVVDNDVVTFSVSEKFYSSKKLVENFFTDIVDHKSRLALILILVQQLHKFMRSIGQFHRVFEYFVKPDSLSKLKITVRDDFSVNLLAAPYNLA